MNLAGSQLIPMPTLPSLLVAFPFIVSKRISERGKLATRRTIQELSRLAGALAFGFGDEPVHLVPRVVR